MRRASHDALTKSVVQRYHPIQTKEANILVTSLLNNPKDIKHHFMRAGASTIMAILYDYPSLRSEHDSASNKLREVFDGAHKRRVLGPLSSRSFPGCYTSPRGIRFLHNHFNSASATYAPPGLRSGSGKPGNNLPCAQRCIFDYSIVSKSTLYVLVSGCMCDAGMITLHR
jgi:hypothetical protein